MGNLTGSSAKRFTCSASAPTPFGVFGSKAEFEFEQGGSGGPKSEIIHSKKSSKKQYSRGRGPGKLV